MIVCRSITIIDLKMDTQQKTLDSFIKSRKRPANEDGLIQKGLKSNATEISKPSRKLSFDSFVQQTVKKPKVSFINIFLV